MYKWISKTGKDQLIIFFNGWGQDEVCVDHLKTDNYDLMIVQSYHQENTEFNIDSYRSIYVVAWSLGVAVANRWMESRTLPIAGALALCGTTQPISCDCGIDPAIFQATLEGWNEKSRQKFTARMYGSPFLAKGHLHRREVNDQIEELRYIQLNYGDGAPTHSHWKRALAGADDRIFNLEQMQTSWGKLLSVEPFAHIPFGAYRTWSELIETIKEEADAES